MHRKSKPGLLPLDTEIETTLKNLRKATSVEDRSMGFALLEINSYLSKKKKKKKVWLIK